MEKLQGRARLCVDPFGLASMNVAPCVAMGVARLSGTGNQALPLSQTRHDWVPLAEIGLLATIRATIAVALRSDLDVSFPLNRPKFGYTLGSDEVKVYQPSVVAVRVGFGIEVRFGL